MLSPAFALLARTDKERVSFQSERRLRLERLILTSTSSALVSVAIELPSGVSQHTQ